MTTDPYAMITARARELGLEQDPRVRFATMVLNTTSDESTRERMANQLDQLTQLAAALNPPDPFLPPPVGLVSTKPIIVALEAHNGEPITIGPEDITSTIALPGATGSGKTTLIIHLLAQILPYVFLWILDLKDDYRALAAHDPRIIIMHANAPYNPLTPPSHLSAAHADALFVDTTAHTLYLGQTGKSELSRALTTTRANHDHPCINDLITTLESSIQRHDTYSERDHKRGLADRLRRFSLVYPGLANTRVGFNLDDILHGHGLYLPANPLTEAEQWLFGFHISHLALFQKHHNRRDGLEHLIVNDEGLQLWNQNNAGQITDAPVLLPLLGMTRELSVGAIVSTNSWSTTHQTLKSNANTLLITTLASHEDEAEIGRTIGLTPDQAAYLNHYLRRGQVIVRLRDRWRQPILGVFPPVPYEKAVDPALWEAAKARTTLLAPVTLPPAIKSEPLATLLAQLKHATTPATASRPAPAPERAKATPARAPAATPAPAAPDNVVPFAQHHGAPAKPAPPAQVPRPKPSTPTPTTPTIALNTSEERLLAVVCDGVTPSTTAYTKAGLSLAGGDAAAKRLSQKGLILRERIVLHAGRGGHGIGLAPTPAGLARAGKARPVKTRGGDSVQHQYLIQELHRALPASTVEGRVGTKAVDLLLALNTERDKNLLTFITAQQPSVTISIALNTGALLAIEVETSAPTKTATNNALQNHAAGITLTLTSVLPNDLKATRDHLTTTTPESAHHAFMVVNVLALLDHLTKGTA